jgi:AbrB family looped-hinge helix DNA binding protein
MTSKLGPKGQVVIPKPIRDRLGMRPGDPVVVEQDGPAARVSKAVTVDDLLGSLPDSAVDPLDVLLGERDRDRRLEEERERRRGT